MQFPLGGKQPGHRALDICTKAAAVRTGLLRRADRAPGRVARRTERRAKAHAQWPAGAVRQRRQYHSRPAVRRRSQYLAVSPPDLPDRRRVRHRAAVAALCELRDRLSRRRVQPRPGLRDVSARISDSDHDRVEEPFLRQPGAVQCRALSLEVHQPAGVGGVEVLAAMVATAAGCQTSRRSGRSSSPPAGRSRSLRAGAPSALSRPNC